MSILRTAARVGVASSVHGRVQRRQQQRFAAQDQHAAAVAATHAQAAAAPPPPAAAPPATPDMSESLAQLKQLGELRDAGVLTDAEFEAKKAVILGG